jgi:hypothetical protein
MEVMKVMKVYLTTQEKKMPKTKSRFTAAEREEDRGRLLRLKQMGIATGDEGNLLTKPNRLILEQIDPEFARVHDLPDGEVAVIVLARLTVLGSGVLITDQRMTLAWDGSPLDLRDPTEHKYFENLVEGLPGCSTPVLNDYLVARRSRLGVCQIEGLIIGSGSNPVPAPYHTEAKVSVALWLRDEQGNEINYNFTGRVDRSIKRKHQRQQQDRRIAAPQLMREGLYEPAKTSVGDHGKTSFGDAITEADSEISSVKE